MSENSWVLKGVDAETRQKAVEEAARRGVCLGDYLTDMVLRAALTDQVATLAGQTEDFAAPEAVAEPFAVRHRLKALERRLSAAVGSLDGTLHALDSSLFDINARVGDLEALASDTAHGLRQALQDMSGKLAAVRLYITDVEENAIARSDAAEAAHQSLAGAYEALKHAVADDFISFARDSSARINSGLSEVRAAADAAAEHAEAAVSDLIAELRAVRESLEQRIADSAAETRGRMHAAFADAAERLGTLAERVVDNERFAARSAEQLRAQITDVEDGAQIALEETAEILRQADSALAADLARAQQNTLAAVAGARAELQREIVDLREDQLTAAARLKLLDGAIANTGGDVSALRGTLGRQIAQTALDGSALRETLEQHIAQSALDASVAREVWERQLAQSVIEHRQTLANAQSDWDDQFGALSARLAVSERETAQCLSVQRADTERVEACAFAALEKLSRDLAAGDAALAVKIAYLTDGAEQARQHGEVTAAQVRQHAEHMGAQTGGAIAELREQQTGALARLRLVESAVGAVESQAAPIEERLSRLESESGPRALDAEFTARISRLERATGDDQKLTELQEQVAVLAIQASAARLDETALQRIDELRARVSAGEVQSGEIAERLHGVARMLSRMNAQHADAATQSEERLHKIELAFTDLRLAGPAATNAADGDVLHALAVRLGEMERRQADAFEALQADLVRFVEDNDQRLAALEQNPGASTVAEEQFAELRRRIEERILGFEQRGVRTLEQVADTVALLEKRFSGQDEARQSA